MKIYITKVEKSDFTEFLEKALPILTEERRERTKSFKQDSNRVTSAAAELLLSFAVNEQLMSGGVIFSESGNEMGVTLRPVLWRKLTADAPGLPYTFTWSDKGKPVFAEPGAPYFSISHTDNLAVVVISYAPVGVDIEGYRDVNEAVIRKAFSETDAEWILSAESESMLRERFIRCWTLKECYVKMLGESLFSGVEPTLFEAGEISEELLAECLVVEENYDKYHIAAVRKK